MSRRIRDKRDRVRQLRVFCTIAAHGSITRAAERLHLTQPAVSLQLRELEYELGAELFERESTGVALTPAGERLQALAGPAIEAMDMLFDDFAGVLEAADAGTVRVAVSNAGSAFVLPPYIKRFRDRYPDATVRIDTMPIHEAARRLFDEQADLALGPSDIDPEGRLDYRELFTYERVLITALDHPLAERASVSPHDSSTYRAIVPPAGTHSRQIGEHAAAALGIDINVAVEVGGWGMLKRYVEAGIGISVVPSFVVNESDQLAVVALEADFPVHSFGVFTPRDRLLSATTRRFLETLVAGTPRRARDARATVRD